METLHYVPESVFVAFEEIPAKDWAAKVYHPAIVRSEEKLYRKPGYTM